MHSTGSLGLGDLHLDIRWLHRKPWNIDHDPRDWTAIIWPMRGSEIGGGFCQPDYNNKCKINSTFSSVLFSTLLCCSCYMAPRKSKKMSQKMQNKHRLVWTFDPLKTVLVPSGTNHVTVTSKPVNHITSNTSHIHNDAVFSEKWCWEVNNTLQSLKLGQKATM